MPKSDLITKYRQQIGSKITRIFNDKADQLRKQNILVVSNAQECRLALTKLKQHSKEYNVLGFDCEWVSESHTRRPVALLQLASRRDMCALFRFSHLASMPSALQTILADSDIVKVGVAPIEDARFLEKDYGLTVTSTLDLRFLAVASGCKPGGLAKMAAEHLKVTLDKRLLVKCSNWEAPQLSREQLDYAAKDALVAVELFGHFAAKIEPKADAESAADYVRRIIDAHCRKNLDQPFKESVESTKSSADSTSTTDAKV